MTHVLFVSVVPPVKERSGDGTDGLKGRGHRVGLVDTRLSTREHKLCRRHMRACDPLCTDRSLMVLTLVRTYARMAQPTSCWW